MPRELQLLIDGIVSVTGPYLPRIAGALAILIIGWLVAFLLSRAVAGGVRLTRFDRLLGSWLKGRRDTPPPVDRWIGSAVYYLVLLLVVVGTIQVLQVTVITEPFTALLVGIFAYLPQLIGAGILLLLAWLLATVLKFVVSQLLTSLNVDRQVASEVVEKEGGRTSFPISQIAGDVVYWLVFLFFLPAVLGALGIIGLLDPVQAMVAEILTYLPNLLAATVILVIGWFIARVVRRLVTNLLGSAGLDRLSERVGLNNMLGQQQLSGLIGLVVYALIFIPVIIAALEALALPAITQPVSSMLEIMLGVVPDILAAALILIIAYVVGRIVSGLVTNLLTGAGFNNLASWLGIGGEGHRPAAEYAGWLLLATIMFFAAMEAADVLGLTLVAVLVSQFITFASQIVFGLVVIAVGLLLANLAARAITGTGLPQAGVLSWIARISILMLATAIGLRMMGIANDIVLLAFAIPLAAIGVAVAIAFGVGGREIAARELNSLIESIRSRGSQS